MFFVLPVGGLVEGRGWDIIVGRVSIIDAPYATTYFQPTKLLLHNTLSSIFLKQFIPHITRYNIKPQR